MENFLTFLKELWDKFLKAFGLRKEDDYTDIQDIDVNYRKYYVMLLDLNIIGRLTLNRLSDADRFTKTIETIIPVIKSMNSGDYSETLPLFEKIVNEYLGNVLKYGETSQNDSTEFLKSLDFIDEKIKQYIKRIENNEIDELNRLLNTIQEMTKE